MKYATTSPSCPLCNLRVAPFDPNRIQKGLVVYHETCLRKQERQQEEANHKPQPIRLHMAQFGLTPRRAF
jgi:hypothetical protein